MGTQEIVSSSDRVCGPVSHRGSFLCVTDPDVACGHAGDNIQFGVCGPVSHRASFLCVTDPDVACRHAGDSVQFGICGLLVAIE